MANMLKQRVCQQKGIKSGVDFRKKGIKSDIHIGEKGIKSDAQINFNGQMNAYFAK